MKVVIRVLRYWELSDDGVKVQDGGDVPVEPGDGDEAAEQDDSTCIHNKDSTKACNDIRPPL